MGTNVLKSASSTTTRSDGRSNVSKTVRRSRSISTVNGQQQIMKSIFFVTALFVLAARIPTAAAQAVQVCICSPPTYFWEIDFSLDCVSISDNGGTKGTPTCFYDEEDENFNGDYAPVRLTDLVFRELNSNLTPIKTENFINGNGFVNGDAITFQSSSALGDVSQGIGGLQVSVIAFNSANERFRYDVIVRFSNTCEKLPFSVGDSFGHLRFTEIIQPAAETCNFSSESPSHPPTMFPSVGPTRSPTKFPTRNPTPLPTKNPTPLPTKNATLSPTKNATLSPTKNATLSPTKNPTQSPSSAPTKNPTPSPTKNPTPSPTKNPTPSPTKNPTETTTSIPTKSPTPSPTKSPLQPPQVSRTFTPSPTFAPTSAPTLAPTTRAPTASPSLSPSVEETIEPSTTASPTTEGPTTTITTSPTATATSVTSSYGKGKGGKGYNGTKSPKGKGKGKKKGKKSKKCKKYNTPVIAEELQNLGISIANVIAQEIVTNENTPFRGLRQKSGDEG